MEIETGKLFKIMKEVLTDFSSDHLTPEEIDFWTGMTVIALTDKRRYRQAKEDSFPDLQILKRTENPKQTAEEIVFGRHESIGRVVEFLDCPPDELTRKVNAFPASFNYWKNKFVRIFRKIDEEPNKRKR